MSPERKAELMRLCNPEKWPNWEMVIYRCGILLSENVELYEALEENNEYELIAFVALGAKRYYGEMVFASHFNTGGDYSYEPTQEDAG